MEVVINAKKTCVNIEIQKNEIELGTTYSVNIVGEPYEGEYEVTPKAYIRQELETQNKVLTENIKVKEIPYFETSNVYGDTVYIGSEV